MGIGTALKVAELRLILRSLLLRKPMQRECEEAKEEQYLNGAHQNLLTLWGLITSTAH
jgi:hypothetical protein